MPGPRSVPHMQLRVPVFLGLKASDKRLADLKKTCDAVSEPTSDAYGHYLSRAQVASITSASANTRHTVSTWLVMVGATNVKFCETGDCVTAALTVETIQTWFGVSNMRWFQSPHGPAVRSTDTITLPSVLTPHVDVVLGIADFPPGRRGAFTQHKAAAARDSHGDRTTSAGTAGKPVPMAPVVVLAALTSTVCGMLCGAFDKAMCGALLNRF